MLYIYIYQWGQKTKTGIKKPNYPVAIIPPKNVIILLPCLGLHSNHITKRLKSCVNRRFYSFVNVKLWSLNSKLFFKEPHHSLQRSNCSILGLTDTVAILASEAEFVRFRVFFGVCPFQNEVGDPSFFYRFGKSRSLPFCVTSLKNICAWELLGANVLK